jgi:hypothetical protein
MNANQDSRPVRRTAATLLLAPGVDPNARSWRCSVHSQISPTLNACSHVLPALRSDATVTMKTMTREGKILRVFQIVGRNRTEPALTRPLAPTPRIS